MTKLEFILRAFKESTCYYKAEWVFTLFTVVRNNEVEQIKNLYPFRIGVMNDKYAGYVDDTWIAFDDSPDISSPLFQVDEVITIATKDDIVQNYSTFPFKTRVGNLFVNYYILVSAFGDKVDYQNGSISISALEDLVTARLVDGNEKDANDKHALYVDEVKKFSSACISIAGFSSIATPSASRYTMVAPPGIKEFKDQLIAKYKDKLDDPAIVAEIDKQLVEYDKKFQAQDPDGGFLYKPKAFNVSRKKLFLMHGYEQSDMSPDPDFVPNSLSEGWDIEKLPSMINSLRDGSFNRGAKTALGGEATKFIFRIFATTRIAEEDCGTKIGMRRTVTKADVNKFIISPNGNNILLTEENIKDFIGKEQVVRSPGFCKTGNANFCLHCLGLNFKGSENALAALASEVGSDMLNIFMSKMHGSQLATTVWKYKETIS